MADKLREPRVHRVLAALLSGEDESAADLAQIAPDDQHYVEDLGLIRQRPQLTISNRIYREIIPRELTLVAQSRISNQELAWYVNPDRRLNMDKLLTAFQQFFREHSEIWEEGFDYREAAPQLLMQAFLQRILNDGGRLLREYGLGRKRTDLLIEWPLDEALGLHGPMQRLVIELKLQRGELERVIAVGLEQTADYADRVGADEAHLVTFNRNRQNSWEEKIYRRREESGGRPITVWGA